MTSDARADRISLFTFRTPQIRALHMTWLALFICSFAWFGIAPLMGAVREDLKLTPNQIGNIIIASVAITIIARLFIGWTCDRFGPRLTYTWLLILGAVPVIGIGLANSYHTFLLFRLAIGAIGASFVLTSLPASTMFAPNCVRLANATTAGWGNMGGGVAQVVMPLIFAGFIALGASESVGWRLAMVVPGIAMLICAIGYFFLTQDSPLGNGAQLRAEAKSLPSKKRGSFLEAASDRRVWALALVYGACFGIEITIYNVAALYFSDRFAVGLKTAGLIAGIFGMLALFARSLGGWFSDRVNMRHGLNGRMIVLSTMLLTQGAFLILFSRAGILPLAIISLILLGLFVHMACGATYAIIPFVNPNEVGSVAAIVGAGGNAGAALSGFLFKGAMPWPTALLILGISVTVCSCISMLVRINNEQTTPGLTGVEADVARMNLAAVAGA